MSNINILCKNLSKNLTTTENIILNSVNTFCKDRLLPRILENTSIDIQRDIYKEMGEFGLLGPTIKGYGCYETSYKTYALIAKEIEYVDSGYRSMYSVQSSLVMKPISSYGTSIIKDTYLPELAKGNKIGCFGLTEAHSGSDASSMKTFAKKDGGDYIISGSKMWITNAPIADIFIIWAKYGNSVRGFVLDRDMPGITTHVINNKMSLTSSITGSIFLDDVRVPSSNILNVDGMKGPLSCLNDARLGIACGVLGAAHSCIETTLDYALSRRLFNSLLAEKQLFQKTIAEMVITYNTALLSTIKVAEMKDNGESDPYMISLIKKNSCSTALDIARKARSCLGANGIIDDYHVFRHMVNLETVQTYEGTDDIHTLILGNYITGLKSF